MDHVEISKPRQHILKTAKPYNSCRNYSDSTAMRTLYVDKLSKF